ncbi:UPF0175 family protein [Acidicapsa dinghuensis]|uniref:UPF0175 family protein n=1 Tax=Acidicapsa dinghuensis TaxID=2218256 RepID=A0ABW1E8R1_9BACT|nr:UPF0175 family protein [Acidicapsa dinghuensis]
MQVTLEIPEDFAQKLVAQGQYPSRAALEAVALEGYRSGVLSAFQARCMLGFTTRYEFDGFLKAHNVWEHAYGLEDLEQDRADLSTFEPLSQSSKQQTFASQLRCEMSS